jgi:hypothetical protein
MKILGVDLTSNDAIVCLLGLENNQFNLPSCRVRKLTLKKEHSRQELQQFQFAFAKLVDDYKVNTVAIKGRMPKGKFAGGAISFKIESAIQLISDVNVVVLSSMQIKSAMTGNNLPIAFVDTGLKVFQQAAFTVAYAAHVME